MHGRIRCSSRTARGPVWRRVLPGLFGRSTRLAPGNAGHCNRVDKKSQAQSCMLTLNSLCKILHIFRVVYTIFSSVKCNGGEKEAKRTLDVVVRIQDRAWLFFLPPALFIPAPRDWVEPRLQCLHDKGQKRGILGVAMQLMYLFPRVRERKRNQ